jgi:hypothetical protein
MSDASLWLDSTVRGESGAIRPPVFRSNCTTSTFPMYDPYVSHIVPSGACNTPGSIAFKFSPVTEFTTSPPSVHLYAGSAAFNVGLVINPTADTLLPQLEIE